MVGGGEGDRRLSRWSEHLSLSLSLSLSARADALLRPSFTDSANTADTRQSNEPC